MEPFQGVSIVMPVFDGAGTLDRAIRSVVSQTDPDWELLAVDDGSTDESHALLCRWAGKDVRIRVIRMAGNRGVSAARNEAVRQARGQVLAYLDCDDEYYPTYVGLVRRRQDRGDVLLFAYDLQGEGAPAADRPLTWDPAASLADLTTRNISAPLGVAHQRRLFERVGGFDESLHYEEDWDLWKRFSRAGATFHSVRAKSGLYHIRRDSHSRLRHVPGKDGNPNTG